MIAAGVFRGQEQENQIDRLVIERIELDRLIQAREHADDLLERSGLDVRYGDATAEPGRAKPFTLKQRVEQFALLKAGEFRGALAEFLQRLLLALGLQGGDATVVCQEIPKIHDSHIPSGRRLKPNSAAVSNFETAVLSDADAQKPPALAFSSCLALELVPELFMGGTSKGDAGAFICTLRNTRTYASSSVA